MAPTDPDWNLDTSDDARNQACCSRSVTAAKPIIRHVREVINDYGRYETPIATSDTSGTSMRITTTHPSASRRPSVVASDPISSLINAAPWPIMGLPTREVGDVATEDDIEREEENLIADNGGMTSILSSRSATDATLSYDVSSMSHADSTHTETSLLLPHEQHRNEDPIADIDHKWDEEDAAGKLQTTWRTEAKILARRSPLLIILAFLQWSLPMSGIFTAGRLGKVELAAVSLGSTTASITCYATYQGLVASLDTLCAQAYGSGKRELVGLQTQRTVLILWCVTILIGALWLCSTYILEAIVPHSEKEVAQLASLYLKILLCGAPAFAAFEAGKRFMLAQGIFAANLYILLFCAPLNAFMSWLFVWQFKWGFVGAPIAIVITDYLLIICLVLYVRFFQGSECWGGLDRRAFKNWAPIIWLTIPGLVMTLAEYLAFEILTLAASWMSTSHLAAQAVLATVIPLMYQGPMSLSIAGSTRIANLIGKGLPGSAKVAAKIVLIAAFFFGSTNAIVLISLRNYLPKFFTPDEDVRRLVSNVIPICVAFQVYDALAASCNGILRGIGRQRFGGWVCLLSYYAVGIPISFAAGFGLGWDLYGLWAGPAIALLLVASIEGFYLYHIKWERVVEEAIKRNTVG